MEVLSLHFPSHLFSGAALHPCKRSTCVILRSTVPGSLAHKQAPSYVEDASLTSLPSLRCSQSSQTQLKPPPDVKTWDVSQSSYLYRIGSWGHPYFSINDRGHVCVHPSGFCEGSEELDLVELVGDLKKKNVQLPMIIRFPEIFQHRLHQLQECFDLARTKLGYKSRFQGVFPIKCNNDRYLLDTIFGLRKEFLFGLEVGSKPELLIAIMHLMQTRNSLLICNGYKDHMYIESALLARQLNINSIIVLEQGKELESVIKSCQKFGIRPVLGVRAKLGVQHGGHWGSTSGDNSKFGLTANQLVEVVRRLRQVEMLDCLQLLHFHIGSQIPSVSTIKDAMDEGSHIYCELALMGASMGYIDVGGGLGIDYDGTKGNSSASIGYNMQTYAENVVAAIFDACILKGVAQPTIITESGRAIGSHQSILVFDVLSSRKQSQSFSFQELEELRGTSIAAPSLGIELLSGKHIPSSLREIHNMLGPENMQECYYTARHMRQEAARLFKVGHISLEERAQVEDLYANICEIVSTTSRKHPLSNARFHMQNSIHMTYYINLSIFRSVPDVWAISQVFPIMPLQRLDERPDVQAVLADLTCDSDGKMDHFMGAYGKFEKFLPVHQLASDESYYLGLFLAGVYQEGMGNAHNLYGGTNVVYIMTKPDLSAKQRTGYIVKHIKWGDAMKDVLDSVSYAADELLYDIQKKVENGQLTSELVETLLANYKLCLDSYTYLS